MKPLIAACTLSVFCCPNLLGQRASVPAKWIGTWELNVSQSTFGTVLFPGVPSDLAILSQRLTLEQTGKAIRLSGDTAVSDSSGSHSVHDDTSVSLDGGETVIGPGSLSFRPIDVSTFEILTKVNISNSNVGEVSRFSFSSDGKTLTETKTQTEREVVPEGVDKTAGAVIKTSKFVLVFTKVPEPAKANRLP
jgi:hypothetical protein